MTKRSIRILVAIAALLVAAPTLLSPAQIPTPKPDFRINVDRQMNAVLPGETATYHVYLAPVGGFDGTVMLDCDMQAPYESYSVSPSKVKLGPSVAQMATITITVHPRAPHGMTHFTLRTRAVGPVPGGGVSHSMPLSLMVMSR